MFRGFKKLILKIVDIIIAVIVVSFFIAELVVAIVVIVLFVAELVILFV